MDSRRRTSTPPARDTSPRTKATTSWILRERPARPLTPPPAVAQPLAVELPGTLVERLMSDPLFQVMSFDRQHWICPYTGRAVLATGGRLVAARSYLEYSGVWRNLAPLPAARIEVERWRHDLTSRLATDTRLRLFSRQGRGWLNPYTGSLEPSVTLEDGTLTPRTITRMAEVLSGNPQALRGAMLPQEEILRRYQQLQASETSAYTHTDTTEVVWIGGQEPDTKTPPTSEEGERGDDDESHRPTTDDLSRASRVQARSLTELPMHPAVALGAHFAPRAGVSGDFYHATVMADGRLLLAVGDVSGHGVQAALVVASALKTLRFVLRAESEPVEIALACNDELREDLLPGQFISLFLAVIDPKAMTLTALCAGHHPALLVNLRREHPVHRIGRSGMALGLGDRAILTRLLRPVTVALEPGDVLVQVTDGLLEARNDNDVQWGEARFMGSVLARCDLDTAQELADGMVHDCRAFAARPVDDDLTVLVAALTADGSN